MAISDPRYIQAARRLRQAAALRTPCPPVRDLIAADDVDGAYLVQRLNADDALAAGRKRAGRKIGLTSEAVQRQLGVDEPDLGVLFDDMVFGPGDVLPFGGLIQPKAEAEIAIVLDRDLKGPDVTAEQARAAVGGVAPAIEIADSRIEGWNITVVDTVADNASAGLAVIGENVPLTAELDLASLPMSMRRNGTVESTGIGAATLGDPLNALAWLARTAAAFGDPLLAGEVVLTGALGPVFAAAPGDRIEVEIGGLGSVHAELGADG